MRIVQAPKIEDEPMNNDGSIADLLLTLDAGTVFQIVFRATRAPYQPTIFMLADDVMGVDGGATTHRVVSIGRTNADNITVDDLPEAEVFKLPQFGSALSLKHFDVVWYPDATLHLGQPENVEE